MRNVYSVSLCRNGVLGGLLYLKDEEMVYCTNKLTVPAHIRRLYMPYSQISEIYKAPFYTVVVSMKNGQKHRFLVFARNSFLQKVQKKV